MSVSPSVPSWQADTVLRLLLAWVIIAFALHLSAVDALVLCPVAVLRALTADLRRDCRQFVRTSVYPGGKTRRYCGGERTAAPAGNQRGWG